MVLKISDAIKQKYGDETDQECVENILRETYPTRLVRSMSPEAIFMNTSHFGCDPKILTDVKWPLISVKIRYDLVDFKTALFEVKNLISHEDLVITETIWIA